ncbi:MAG: CARDB domain-containing protein [Actinomycetota bacterium]
MSRKTVSLVGACALLLTMLVPNGAAAARKPDLVVVSVKTASDSVEAGGRLPATVKLKNRGRGRAGASEVRFYLDRNGARDKSDRRFGGSIAVGRIKAKKATRLRARLRVPAGSSPGAYRLLACADDRRRVRETSERNNCRASVGLIEVLPPPTSAALIQRAVDRGQITEEEGLTYDVYAAFGDGRLPDRFAVEGPAAPHGGGAIRDVAARWGGLSAQGQAGLAPFLAPPAYEGSWAEPVAPPARAAAGPIDCTGRDTPPAIDSDWAFKETAHTKIWYRTVDVEGASASESESVAGQIAGAIEHIRTEVTTLFGTEAPPDFLEACNGGDDRLDVYVMPVSGLRAVTVPFPPGDKLVPSFMVVDASAATDEKRTRDIVAHEFAHTLHIGAYDYHEDTRLYRWLEEATANWVIDHIYPDDNVIEHDYAAKYLTHPGKFVNPIEEQLAFGGENGYEDYLFLLHVARKFGPQHIKAIWDGVIASNSIDAVDDAIPGGWKERWPDFALWAWNRTGVDFLEQLDAIPWGLPTEDLISLGAQFPGNPHSATQWPGRLDVELEGKKKRAFNFGIGRVVYTRAINYSYFTFPDDRVRSVKLKYFSFNDLLEEEEWALRAAEFGKVQAWMRLADGSTRVEDWTHETEVELCRDRATEDVQELVLLYTYSEPTTEIAGLSFSQGYEPREHEDKLTASRASCDFPERWTGTASGTITDRGVTHTWTADVTLKKTFEDTGVASYEAESIAWNVGVEGTYPDGRGGECSVSGSVTWTEADDFSSGLSIFEYGDPELDDEYSITLLAGPPSDASVTENCPSTGSKELPWFPLNIPDEAETFGQPWTPGSTSLSGNRSYPSRMDDSIQVEFAWDLSAG